MRKNSIRYLLLKTKMIKKMKNKTSKIVKKKNYFKNFSQKESNSWISCDNGHILSQRKHSNENCAKNSKQAISAMKFGSYFKKRIGWRKKKVFILKPLSDKTGKYFRLFLKKYRFAKSLTFSEQANQAKELLIISSYFIERIGSWKQISFSEQVIQAMKHSTTLS